MATNHSPFMEWGGQWSLNRRARGRSCHPRPLPLTGPGPAPWPAGHGSRARWPGPARRDAGDHRGARAVPGPRAPQVGAIRHDPDRLLVRSPLPVGERVPRRPQPGQVRPARPPDPLPDHGEPVVPGSSERADRDRDQAGQRVDPPPVSAGPAALPVAATPLRPGPGRRDRTHARAAMTLRECRTSFMQTSETYMVRRRARVRHQRDFVLLVTCHTKRDNSGTRRSPVR